MIGLVEVILVFGFPVFDFDVLIDLTRCAWRIERMPQLKLGLKSCENFGHRLRYARDWLVLIAHLRTIAPGGARSVIAESLLLKHQLLILNRSRKKAPRLRSLDRVLLGLGAILVSPQRILKVAVAIRPATLLRFHRALVRRKYRWLFCAKNRGGPGPRDHQRN
jgi:hypothetical protein